MSRVLTKLVSQNRVKELLGCYGGSPESWPEDERSAALSLLEGTEQLRDLQDQENQLDRVMQEHKEVTEEGNARLPVAALMNRIIENLPEQEKRVVVKDNTKDGQPMEPTLFHRNKFLFGSIAASFMVIVSMVMLTHVPYQVDVTTPYQAANLNAASQGELAFNSWAWDDIIDEDDEDDDDDDGGFSLSTLSELDA